MSQQRIFSGTPKEQERQRQLAIKNSWAQLEWYLHMSDETCRQLYPHVSPDQFRKQQIYNCNCAIERLMKESPL